MVIFVLPPNPFRHEVSRSRGRGGGNERAGHIFELVSRHHLAQRDHIELHGMLGALRRMSRSFCTCSWGRMVKYRDLRLAVNGVVRWHYYRILGFLCGAAVSPL